MYTNITTTNAIANLSDAALSELHEVVSDLVSDIDFETLWDSYEEESELGAETNMVLDFFMSLCNEMLERDLIEV